jgi:hypothetical protein
MVGIVDEDSDLIIVKSRFFMLSERSYLFR